MQLFFSVFNRDGVVALFENGDLVIKKSITVAGREADNLLVVISELLDEIGRDISELEKIACVVGPGAFTSLRVGVMVANSLAFCLSIPVVGVTAFEYLSLLRGGLWPVYVEAGRSEVFCSKDGLVENTEIIPVEDAQAVSYTEKALEEVVPAFFEREGQKQIEPLYIKDAHITQAKKL